MGGLCHLYLLMILLMRSGDVETNPGPDRIVSEEEFIKLSKLIEPSYYKGVGVNLGISIAELGQIKERSLDTSDALISVFTRWRDKQPQGTDIRALLAEGFKRSHLESLSSELLAGSLVPNRTGENKKEIMSPVRKKAFTAIDNTLLLQAANKHRFATLVQIVLPIAEHPSRRTAHATDTAGLVNSQNSCQNTHETDMLVLLAVSPWSLVLWA